MITYLLKLGKHSYKGKVAIHIGQSSKLKVNILCLPVINQIPSATFPDTPCQLLLSQYHLYVQALIIQELID